jgi:sugar lactone lactonase YvrE
VAERALWFVDIKQRRIHRYDPAAGDGRSWDAPSQPGFLVPYERGGFIVGLANGLHRFGPDAGAFFPLVEVEPELPGNRLNDGAVDHKGRLWFGSMDDGERAPSGRLYRLERDGPRALDDGYVITNGPAFSPDGKVFYHTDTLAKTIYAFDLDEAGAITNKRAFVRIEEGAGYPDGSVVDEEGCLWTSLFGGWGVRRYSPSGELVRTVEFPCANVTKIAFGGPDLRTVYATTARKGLKPEDLAVQPDAGGLFRFDADVRGLPSYEVRDG